LLNVDQITGDAIARTEMLAWKLFARRQDGVGAAQVDDEATFFDPAARSRDELAFTDIELFVQNVALGIPDLLDDHLFRGLSGDAAELGGVELHADAVADFDVRIQVLRFRGNDLCIRVHYLFHDGLELKELDFAQIFVEVRLDLA